MKASIMLEETGRPDEAYSASFETQDQWSPEFIATFPNNKIPAIIDPNGPGGQALTQLESGAILPRVRNLIEHYRRVRWWAYKTFPTWHRR